MQQLPSDSSQAGVSAVVVRRLRSFRSDCARWGLARSLFMRFMASQSSWLNVSYAVQRDLRRPLPNLTFPSDVSFRLVEHRELLLFLEDPEIPLSKTFVDDAVSRGDICVGAFAGDRLVAFTWRAFRSTPHAHGLMFSFAKPYRYGYHAFTLPAYRGMHLQEALSKITDALCIERGHTHGMAFIEICNYPSLTMTARTGSERVGIVGYIRLLGGVFPFRSAGARRKGVGFVSKSQTSGSVA